MTDYFIRTLSPFQIDELAEYFAYSKVHSLARVDSTGDVVISFVSHFDKNQEIRTMNIPREPKELGVFTPKDKNYGKQ